MSYKGGGVEADRSEIVLNIYIYIYIYICVSLEILGKLLKLSVAHFSHL